MSEPSTGIQVRRVVTTQDAEGRSRVWMDGPATNVKRPADNIASVLLWATEGSPADYLTEDDAGEWKLGTSPLVEGSRFVHFTLAPGGELTEPHRNDTLDYTVCVAGELTFYLDEGSVVLRPGDVFIQRGTTHWLANHGDVPASTVSVLLDGTPKREGSMTRAEQAR